MLNYFLGYAAFLFGSLFYILTKIQEYKTTAKLNPNPAVAYSLKDLISEEWINILKMYLGGIALVWLFPKLVGGSTVELKTAAGITLLNLSVKAACVPIYFFFGYSGNSALFAFFGKYKKTILSQVGADEKD
jgi:hypothetical protein